jgi:hypothetical protein
LLHHILTQIVEDRSRVLHCKCDIDWFYGRKLSKNKTLFLLV